jgi:hypothetical protein
MTALETFTTASKQPLTTGRRPDMTALETFTTASKQPLTTGRRPDMTAVALANKIARIVFVLMTRGGHYDDRPVAA